MSRMAFKILIYLRCLSAPCRDCLYFGLFTLPLQSKQGMVSEMGKRESQEEDRWAYMWIKFDWYNRGQNRWLCFKRLQSTNGYLSCEWHPDVTAKWSQNKTHQAEEVLAQRTLENTQYPSNMLFSAMYRYFVSFPKCCWIRCFLEWKWHGCDHVFQQTRTSKAATYNLIPGQITLSFQFEDWYY